MMLARLAYMTRANQARVGPRATRSITPTRSLFMFMREPCLVRCLTSREPVVPPRGRRGEAECPSAQRSQCRHSRRRFRSSLRPDLGIVPARHAGADRTAPLPAVRGPGPPSLARRPGAVQRFPGGAAVVGGLLKLPPRSEKNGCGRPGAVVRSAVGTDQLPVPEIRRSGQRGRSMSMRETTVLGIFIVAGLGLHGYLSRPAPPPAPEHRTELRGEVKATLDLSPKALNVGTETLLFIPYRAGNGVDWGHSLYRLEKGVLKRVEQLSQ